MTTLEESPVSLADKEELMATPSGFVSVMMNLELYWWQSQFLELFRGLETKPVRASLATPNGSGKSSVVIPGLIFWFLSVYPKGRMIITTKDGKQLDGQIWQAVKQYEHKFPEWKFLKSERKIELPTGGFCKAFTTDEAGNAEGWHPDQDKTDGPLLIVVDEAKSVSEQIFQAFARCTYNAIAYISSPGSRLGTFYRTFADPALGFDFMKVGFADCPHKPKHTIDHILSTWGKDHPFTRSTLFGEFMNEDAETRFVVPMSRYELCLANPPQYREGGKIAFCDFAAGGAENVVAVKHGNRAYFAEYWHETNTMAACARFITIFKREGLRPGDIWGDNSGLGKVMIDRLHELGWPINRFNGNEKADNDAVYDRRSDEIWFEASNKIDRLEVILPDDETTKEQAVMRRVKDRADGKLQMLSKEDMMKLYGYASPDRFDALAGVISIESVVADTVLDKDGIAHLDGLAQLTAATVGYIEQTPTTLTFRQGSQGWLDCWEKSAYGMSYLAVLKMADYGERQDHELLVMRAGYKKSRDKWVKPRVVATLTVGVRWDLGPLVDQAKMLCDYYGRCMLVPIVGQRLDMVQAFRERGQTLYVRRDIEKVRGERTKVIRYGWDDDDLSRSIWIGSLADAVRQQSLDLESGRMVRDLYQFNVESPPASCQCLGVGLYLLGEAQMMAPPKIIANQGWNYSGDSATA